jgi:hypothetical protein
MATAKEVPALIKLVDFLGEKVPGAIAKHPTLTALTAAGIGAGLGADNMRGPAHVLEGSLMAEQLGVPGSKYGCDELSVFAMRKDYISTKLAFEKVADWNFSGDFSSGVSSGIGKETARTGIGAIRQAISAISDAIKEKTYTEPARNMIFKEIVQNDPVVSTFEREQPGSAAQAYATMKRFAPELSTDKYVVTAFLRNAAMSGGPLDHNMIKGIADAESSVHKARNEAAWYPGGKL